MSPLDWALVDSWKSSGIPLEAVLRGIDVAFGKWHARKKKTQMVNSIAYCAQAVLTEAQAMTANVQSGGAVTERDAPLPIETVRGHLARAAAALAGRCEEPYQRIGESVRSLEAQLAEHFRDLQDLDQRLTVLEEKMAAVARTLASDEELLELRQALERQLRPYRSKLSADQLARLEKSYLDRALFEKAGLPRLSLFYI
jgi:flagellar motility protein MotE (MotC chaperone)